VIIGQKEVLDGTAIIRDMDAGTQETVDAKKIVQEIRKKLKSE
jgi:histidyl-tRNA synthetase